MGRKYTAVFEGVSVAAVQDLFEINAPSDAIVVIHDVHITQDASETSEQLPFAIKRSTGSSGSGGSVVTPRQMESGDAAFGGTVEANNTTQATTVTTLRRRSENMLNGVHWQDLGIKLSPSARVVVTLETAPAAPLDMSGEIVFEEIGG